MMFVLSQTHSIPITHETQTFMQYLGK